MADCTIKASGDSTRGAFALIEASVPPGGGPPPHVHSREDEAFYVLDGELEVLAGRSTVLARVATSSICRGASCTDSPIRG